MMNIIEIAARADGRHNSCFGVCTTPAPTGWARIPDDMALPDSYPYVDIEVIDEDGVPTVTVMSPREVPEPETPDPAPAATPTTNERIAALEAAQSDTDSLMVDQEYRLTLLELGINETTV